MLVASDLGRLLGLLLGLSAGEQEGWGETGGDQPDRDPERRAERVGDQWRRHEPEAPRLVAAVVLGDGVSIALTLQILRFSWIHRSGVTLSTPRSSTTSRPRSSQGVWGVARSGRRP